LGYLPEDRKAQGLFLEMNVAENIVASHLGKVANKGFISNTQQRAIAQEYVQKLAIKTPNLKQKVINLSGGNQQKIMLARWLMRNPAVFIVDEPTHGIDVGAKAEIYKILRELARQGIGILLISSELPEVLTLSDRILVMWNGKVTAELSREEASEQEIMHYASGTKNMYA
jgi:ABC-type sugar transport system ATPase subunit